MRKKYSWVWNGGEPKLLLNGCPIAVLTPISIPTKSEHVRGWYVKTIEGTQNTNTPIVPLREALAYTEGLFSLRKIEADKSNLILHIPVPKKRERLPRIPQR